MIKTSFRLSQAANEPDPTPGQIRAMAAGVGTVATALSAATAWVGLSTGSRERGLLSTAGYVVGILGGLNGLSQLFATGKVLFMNDAELRELVEKESAVVPQRPAIAGRRVF